LPTNTLAYFIVVSVSKEIFTAFKGRLPSCTNHSQSWQMLEWQLHACLNLFF